ncbi:MAG TPA: TonB-dependent receptor plug domain-containing protein, partial [Gemmatimonadales bacterium]|nr:TonB-dependent receptor plug domain-containing protein [Gemmatimonadales bacterium]
MKRSLDLRLAKSNDMLSPVSKSFDGYGSRHHLQEASVKRIWVLALLVPLAVAPGARAQTRIVTGHVTSAVTKDPLSHVSIEVLGTVVHAVTNDSGQFSIAASDGAATLLVRIIGYKRKLVPVAAGVSFVEVALEQDVFNLEAVVVTGLATGVEQRNLPNAVTTIRSDRLVGAPTSTLEGALQGKVPGALIQMNSGAPGGGGQIDLRGVTTINARIDPLIVVDGVVISDAAIPGGLNAVTDAAGGGNSSNQDNPVNRIADLNPADIAQIEVLKGASAAAIYGSQAANGVIVVTTKRGEAGKPRFSMTQRFGGFRDSKTLGSRVFKDSADAAG